MPGENIRAAKSLPSLLGRRGEDIDRVVPVREHLVPAAPLRRRIALQRRRIA